MTDAMYESIPLQPVAAQRVQAVLGGQPCNIHLYSRGGRMFMDLAVSGTVIGEGMVCQNQGNMPVWATASFQGKLRFFDIVNDTDPQIEGLGSRYLLVWVSPDKLHQEEEAAKAVSDPLANLPDRFKPPIIRSYASQEDV